MTEPEFLDCLRQRYGGKDFALIPQVRNQTGYAHRVRTADALAISLWPSRGIDVHGFEFKDSRTDWLKELNEPAKSEEIGVFCAYWWLVVSDPKIFTADELPSAWGALHATETGPVILKKAPRRESQDPTWPFVAAVMRAALEVVTDEAEIKRRIDNALAAQAKRDRKYVEQAEQRGFDRGAYELKRIQEEVTAFEDSSGLTLREYPHSAQDVGKAVRFVLDGGLNGITKQFADIARRAEIIMRTAQIGAPV